MHSAARRVMTNREEVFDLIRGHPEGLDDDDISEMTGIRPRQQVQQKGFPRNFNRKADGRESSLVFREFYLETATRTRRAFNRDFSSE